MWTFQYKHGDRPLEGYTILRAAGRGGFGEVYQAVSDGGREVALKAITGYEQIELRGIAQCMNLKSPHLVTIFDVKQSAAGRPFVVMEYMSGPNLRQLLDESPAGLGPQKAAFFLREIAKGLTYLHDCGVVHRDLKPANIFYENGQVKIGDYGLSKAISTSQHSGQTVTVGTVHYMAPEVGAGRYDRSIDIYALGAVLYEMITGTVPYVGSTPTEILLKHLSGEPDVTGIPEPFAAAIKKAMAKDPAQRFQSAQELVEAVFGAEHVRQSMSVFSADELSIVAERAARNLAAVGAGVGAGVGSGGTARPVGAGGRGGALGGGGAESSSVVGAGKGVAQPDFWQRVGNVVDRAVSYGDWRDGDEAADPNAETEPGARPARGPAPDADEAAADAADPMPGRQRAVVAVIVSLAAALAAAPASERAWVEPLGPILFVLASVWGGLFALRQSTRRLVPAMRRAPSPVRRLAVGGVVCLAILLASSPAWAMARNEDMVLGACVAICASLMFNRLRGWTDPARPSRVWLPMVLKAAIPGVIIAFILEGSAPLAAAVLAGLCMSVQVMTPWRPAAAGSGAAADRTDRRAGTPAAAAVAFAPPPPPAPPRPPAPPAPPVAADVAYAAYPSAAAFSAPRRVRQVPAFVSLLWLLGVAAGFTAAVMSFYVAGTTSRLDEVGPFVAGGIGSALLFLLCLDRAFRRTFTSWWSYLVRPVLMLLCAASALASVVVMGNAPHLRDDEAMFGMFFIVASCAVMLLMALLPRTALGAALTRPQAPVKGAAGRTDPAAAGASAGVSAGASAGEVNSPHDPRTICFLCALAVFGTAGIHRMTVGKVWTGLLWFFTLGLVGAGTLFDLIQILRGRFTDVHGRRLRSPLDPVPTEDAESSSAASSATSASQSATSPEEVPAMNTFPQRPVPVADVPAGAPSAGVGPAWAGPQSDAAYDGPALLSDVGRRAGSVAGALVSAAGLTIVLVAVLVGLTALVAPGIAGSGLIDARLAADLREQEMRYPEWWFLVHRVGTALSVLLALVGASLVLFARRRHGIGHVARGGIGVAGMLISLMPLHSQFRRHAGFYQGFNSGPLADESIALSMVRLMLDPSVLVPAALIFFASMILLAWPANRGGSRRARASAGGVNSATPAGELQRA